MSQVELRIKNAVEVFLDIVFLFSINFMQKNNVDVEKLMVFAIRRRKKKLIFKSCGGEPHSEY